MIFFDRFSLSLEFSLTGYYPVRWQVLYARVFLDTSILSEAPTVQGYFF